MKQTIILGLCWMMSMPSWASTWADVTRVEPIFTTKVVPSADPLCRTPKPNRSDGLAALLLWDVTADCEPERRQIAERYRVYYRWQGRELSYISRTPPGEQVKLHVRVDPI